MTDRLNPGESLGVNESLDSPGGEYSLFLQPDGNLVLYDRDRQPVWASGTNGQDVTKAAMQQDGNFVLYAQSGDPVWATDTYGNDGAYLVIQEDRNVVIYSTAAAPLWATNTMA